MNLTASNFNEKYWNSFKGIANLYGIENLYKFSQSQVIVVGVGGVGSWAVESLARTGIGCIIMIDADDISNSNINRQLPALNSTVGDDKTQCLAQRCKDINPLIDIQTNELFLTEDNTHDLIKPQTFITNCLAKPQEVIPKNLYVIDAIDDGAIKTYLADYCRRKKIKLVICGAAGGKFDPSKVCCNDLTQTVQDPLLANIRNHLRRRFRYREIFGNKKFNLPCVYSTEQIKLPEKLQACDVKSLNCSNGYGSVTMVTATFANFAVSKIIDIIMKKG